MKITSNKAQPLKLNPEVTDQAAVLLEEERMKRQAERQRR